MVAPMKTIPPAVTIAPPRFGEPSAASAESLPPAPIVVSAERTCSLVAVGAAGIGFGVRGVPNGTRQATVPVARLTATSSPNGGFVHGTPAGERMIRRRIM